MISELAQSIDLVDWSHPVNHAHPLNYKLSGWWLAVPNRMGWRSGTWRNLVGRNNGTLTAMDYSTDWTTGADRPGGWGAVNFDGTGDYVDIQSTAVDGSGTVTVCAWANRGPTNVAGPNLICEFGGVTYGLALYYRNSPNTLHFGTSRNSTTLELDSTSTFAESSPWFHICGVMNGTSCYLYINGIEEASGTNAGSWSQPSDNGAIGYQSGTVTGAAGITLQRWHGDIDDVRVWNRALTSSQVMEVYRNSQMHHVGLLNRIPLPQAFIEQAAVVAARQRALMLTGVGS